MLHPTQEGWFFVKKCERRLSTVVDGRAGAIPGASPAIGCSKIEYMIQSWKQITPVGAGGLLSGTGFVLRKIGRGDSFAEFGVQGRRQQPKVERRVSSVGSQGRPNRSRREASLREVLDVEGTVGRAFPEANGSHGEKGLHQLTGTPPWMHYGDRRR